MLNKIIKFSLNNIPKLPKNIIQRELKPSIPYTLPPTPPS